MTEQNIPSNMSDWLARNAEESKRKAEQARREWREFQEQNDTRPAFLRKNPSRQQSSEEDEKAPMTNKNLTYSSVVF